MKMKVLLAQAPSAPNRNTGPPMGLGYLGSYLEKEGHKVKIIDSIILRYTLDDVKRELKSFNPDVVGLSVTTPYFYDALRMIEIAKKINPNCLIVLGGAHPTVVPHDTLSVCSDIDVIVRGEGELTFTQLIDSFEKNRSFYGVRGISFRENGRIIHNPERPVVEDLDSLPFPAYHLLPMDKYRVMEKMRNIGLVGKQGQRFGTITTSRGCPYNCAFCAARALWGKKWRCRSAENIIEELKILRYKYGQKIMEFMDDSFTVDKSRILKLCKLIKEEGIDLTWVCETRVDLFDYDIASAMKSAGCELVVFGIESGNQSSLDYLKKGFNVDDSIKAINNAKKAGLKVGAPFIIGVPGENRKMIMETLSFARKLNLDYSAYGLLTPLPGTEINRIAKENNWIIDDDLSKYDFGNPVMSVPGFSSQELKKLLVKAHFIYFLNQIFSTNVIRNLNKFLNR